MTDPVSAPPASSASWAPASVLFCALLQIVTPTLPFIGIGEPIGAQSDSVRTLITPAGWAFSIWGPLYSGSIASAVYQFLAPQRRSALLAQIRMPAAGAFLGNALWAAYTQLYGLSAVSSAIILFTLICLLTIFRRLIVWPSGFRTGERWFVVLPLTALAAWLTVATVVNISASLSYHGVSAGDAAATIAAVILIVAGLIAAAALIGSRGNPPYALVFLWALAAIYAAGGQEAPAIAAASIVAALLVVAGAVLGWRRGGRARWLRR